MNEGNISLINHNNVDDIMVSVIVLTYGHEHYIRKALDSILMQKVNFKYEIIVGEDCSPDDTRVILKEYEVKYPDIFVVIYRDLNLGAKKNLLDILSRSRGKYIASLEGDDFWVSEDKLQIQVDFLENHDDFIATAHRVKIVDKFGNEIANKHYLECKHTEYSLKDYQKGILPGQSASIVQRNVYKNYLIDLGIITKIASMPSDRVMMYLLISHGRVYCFPNIMSAYRYITDSGTSFSARKQKNEIDNPLNQIEYYKVIMDHSHQFINNREAIETIESIYFYKVVCAFIIRCRKVKWNYVKGAWKNIQNPSQVLRFVACKLITLPIKKAITKINNMGLFTG